MGKPNFVSKEPPPAHRALPKTEAAIAAYDEAYAKFHATPVDADDLLEQCNNLDELGRAVGRAFGEETCDINSIQTCEQCVRPGPPVPGPGYELSFVRRMVNLGKRESHQIIQFLREWFQSEWTLLHDDVAIYRRQHIELLLQFLSEGKTDWDEFAQLRGPKASGVLIRKDKPDGYYETRAPDEDHTDDPCPCGDKKQLPMRQQRWCCEIIKEAGGRDRIVIVGNRWAESNRRSHQCYIADYKRKKIQKKLLRPILGFTNYDVWQYIRENNLHYCSLYDEGFERIGCVLCPYGNNVKREEEYFPKVVKLWKLACDKIVANMIEMNYISKRGKPMKYQFQTGEELYQWWTKRR